jgi:hypothetical protein
MIPEEADMQQQTGAMEVDCTRIHQYGVTRSEALMKQERIRMSKTEKKLKERATINIDRALKIRAKKYCLDHQIDLQDLIADGLKMILAEGK